MFLLSTNLQMPPRNVLLMLFRLELAYFQKHTQVERCILVASDRILNQTQLFNAISVPLSNMNTTISSSTSVLAILSLLRYVSANCVPTIDPDKKFSIFTSKISNAINQLHFRLTKMNLLIFGISFQIFITNWTPTEVIQDTLISRKVRGAPYKIIFRWRHWRCRGCKISGKECKGGFSK